MLFLWYCFDEWAVLNWHLPAWAGHIPWPLVLLAHIPVFIVLSALFKMADD